MGGNFEGVWTKPPQSYVKCNIDASFSTNLNKVGVGLCLRDEIGLFMGAKTLWFEPIVDVRIGEALGLKAAVEWMREIGFEEVVFEMDSKFVVDDIKSRLKDNSEFGDIIDDCRMMLFSAFKNSHVEFIMRQANMVAHSLTKAAVFGTNPQYYYDVLTCIEHLIFNEMN